MSEKWPEMKWMSPIALKYETKVCFSKYARRGRLLKKWEAVTSFNYAFTQSWIKIPNGTTDYLEGDMDLTSYI